MTAQPVRVLFVDPVGDVGGAEVALLQLVAGLDRSSFAPHVLCLQDGPLVARFRELNVPVEVSPVTRVRHVREYVRTLARLCALIRRYRIQVVVSNTGKPHFYTAPAASLMRIREVLYLQDPPNKDSLFDRALGTLPTDYIISVTPQGCRLASAGMFRTRGCSVIPNGIDVEAFTSLIANAPPLDRRGLGIAPDALLVLHPARLQPHKGQRDLIAAAPRVLRACPEAHFLLVGGALFGHNLDYPAQLRKEIEDRDLSRHITLAGHWPRERVASALREAAAVALPSHSEGVSLALLEAMAARRPVVTTALEGTRLVVEDATTAALFSPGDTEALADALIEVLTDSDRAAAMGAAARARVASRFDVNRITREVAEVLHRVAGVRGPVARATHKNQKS